MSNDSKTGGLSQVKHVVLVLSGKGGVGKSTTSTALALALRAQGLRVGLLDVDLTGPSLPRMLSVHSQQVHQSSNGWVPVHVADRLSCMSIAFLLSGKDDAVVWRGPKKNAMIKQFLEDVAWGELDFLVIDTPPGTGDEHIALVEHLKAGNANLDGAVVVTTPQEVALADVRKELSFCVKVDVKVLGIVENMSGYVCPTCSECYNLFSKGGGESLAKEHNLPFLGCVPIDPALVTMIESDEGGIVANFEKSSLFPIFKDVASKVLGQCETSLPR